MYYKCILYMYSIVQCKSSLSPRQFHLAMDLSRNVYLICTKCAKWLENGTNHDVIVQAYGNSECALYNFHDDIENLVQLWYTQYTCYLCICIYIDIYVHWMLGVTLLLYRTDILCMVFPLQCFSYSILAKRRQSLVESNNWLSLCRHILFIH